MGAEIGHSIADAGPIIHLHEIGALSFLRLFETVHVPGAVWKETIGKKRVPVDRLEALEVVQRHEVASDEIDSFVERENLDHLQSGEQECLLLLSQQSVDLVLTDDLAVRETVKEMGITPVGSLGVVVRAYREEWIALHEAERLLRELHEKSTLFVTAALIEKAIGTIREQS